MKHSFCFFRGVLVFVCSQRRQGPSPKAVRRHQAGAVGHRLSAPHPPEQWDEADAGSPSLPRFQVRGTRPSASGFASPLPNRGEPPAGQEQPRRPCSHSPIPPAVPPAHGTGFHSPKPPREGCPFPAATAALEAHTRSCWPAGPRRSPPALGGGRETGVAETGKAGGHVGFSGRSTLVPVQHQPRPSPPSGPQLGLVALLPSVRRQPPEGDFVTGTSVGRGGGVR